MSDDTAIAMRTTLRARNAPNCLQIENPTLAALILFTAKGDVMNACAALISKGAEGESEFCEKDLKKAQIDVLEKMHAYLFELARKQQRDKDLRFISEISTIFRRRKRQREEREEAEECEKAEECVSAQDWEEEGERKGEGEEERKGEEEEEEEGEEEREEDDAGPVKIFVNDDDSVIGVIRTESEHAAQSMTVLMQGLGRNVDDDDVNEDIRNEIVQKFSLGLNDWDDWLAMRVFARTSRQRSSAEIIACCMCEMLRFGLDYDFQTKEFGIIKHLRFRDRITCRNGYSRCNGVCNTVLIPDKTKHYRCLDCHDFDLCQRCFDLYNSKTNSAVLSFVQNDPNVIETERKESSSSTSFSTRVTLSTAASSTLSSSTSAGAENTSEKVLFSHPRNHNFVEITTMQQQQQILANVPKQCGTEIPGQAA